MERVIRSKHSCGQSRNFEVNLDSVKSEKLQKGQNKVDEKWRWPNWRSLHCVSKFSMFWVSFYLFGCLH